MFLASVRTATASRARLARRAGALALAALATLGGVTCRDNPTGPGLPSTVSLAVVPHVQPLAADGPTLTVTTLTGVLMPPGGGAPYRAQAAFVNGTATLVFGDVSVFGPTQLMHLSLAALGTAGDTLFRLEQDVTVRGDAAEQPVTTGELRYAGHDAAVASVALAPRDTTLLALDTAHLRVSAHDSSGAALASVLLGWTARDTSVLLVDHVTGKITAGARDDSTWVVAGTVYATIADSALVHVRSRVGAVAISPRPASVIVGRSAAFTATVTSTSGAVLTRAVLWQTSDPAIATVTTAGVLTANAVGAVRLVASVEGKADTLPLQVVPEPVATVVLRPDTNAIAVGAQGALFAVTTLGAAGDTLTGRTVAWSSLDPASATVDAASGVVAGVAVGTARIVATSEGKADTAIALVQSGGAAIALTTIDPPSATLDALGAQLQLVARSWARGASGDSLVAGSYTWASTNPAAVPVSATGVITAKASDTASIIATEQGGTADTARITVQQLVATVQVTPAFASPRVGDTLTLAAQAVDALGNPMTVAGGTSWRATAPGVASVDAKGFVQVLAAGVDTIVATVGGMTGRAVLTVQSAVAQVKIVPQGATAIGGLGLTADFTATAYDATGAAIAAPVRWESSNPSVAALVATDPAARLQALQNGVTTLRATADGVTGELAVTVQQQPASVQLTPAVVQVQPGGRSYLFAQLLDLNGQPMSGTTATSFTWASSNAAKAQVDANGEVLASDTGTVTITATGPGGATGTATVQVTTALAQGTIALGADTLALGLDSVLVPVLLDRKPAAPMRVVLRSDSAGVAGFTVGSVTFDTAATRLDVWVKGYGAGTAHLFADDSSYQQPAYVSATAVAVVRSGAMLAQVDPYAGTAGVTPYDTLFLNGGDGRALQVFLGDPAPAGGTPVAFQLGDSSIATAAPAPAFVPAGRMSADVTVEAHAAGRASVTPATRGLAGRATVVSVAAPVLAMGSAASDCVECQPRLAPAGAASASTATTTTTTTTTGGRAGAATAAAFNAPRRAATASRPLYARYVRRMGTARRAVGLAPRATTSADTMILGVGQYSPSASRDGYCYDYDCGVEVWLPNPTWRPLSLGFTSDAPDVARPEDGFTIPGGGQYAAAFFAVNGLAAGATTLRATGPAPWSAGSMAVIVTTPRVLAVPNLETLVVPGDTAQDYLDVVVTDSLYVEHPRLASLAVHLSSSDPAVLRVEDTLAIVAADSSYRSGIHLTPVAPGTAWVRVRAGGHLPDSVLITVEAHRLQAPRDTLSVATGHEDRQQLTVSRPYPEGRNLLLTARALDPAIVTLPATDTVRAIAGGGTGPVTFPLDGVAAGVGRVLVSADSGFAAETVYVRVGAPALSGSTSSEAPTYTPTVGLGTTATVYVRDSVAWSWQTALAAGGDSVRVQSSDPAVVALDTVIVVPQGQYSAAVRFVPIGAGPVVLRFSATGMLPDSATLTVRAQPLTLAARCTYVSYGSCYGYAPTSVGVGQQGASNDGVVSLALAPAADVSVTLAHRGGTFAQLPATVVIPAGSSSAAFGWTGVAAGSDTVVATAPGYDPATFVLTVTPGRIGSDSTLTEPRTTLSAPSVVPLWLADTLGYHHPAAGTALLVTSSNPDVLALDSTTVHLAAGDSAAAVTVTFVGAGTATIKVTDSAGVQRPFTLGPVTVGGAQSLQMGASAYTLGMRQHFGAGAGVLVRFPQPLADTLTVSLASSDPSVARPLVTSQQLPAGTSEAYFDVAALDTTGSVRLTASAAGYTPASTLLEVGTPQLYVSTGYPSYTTTPPVAITVSLADQSGQARLATAPVTVRLAVSDTLVARADSALVTIAADSSESATALLSYLAAGHVVVTAADTASGFAAYRPATAAVDVTQPAVYASWPPTSLGIGQYTTIYAYTDDALAADDTVRITHGNPAAGGGDSTALITAQGSSTQFVVEALASGTDTIRLSLPGHRDSSFVLRMAPGTIRSDLPSTLVAGDTAAVILSLGDPDGYTGVTVRAATTLQLQGDGAVEWLDAATGAPVTSVVVPADGGSVAVKVHAIGAAGSIGQVHVSEATGSYLPYAGVVTLTP